MRERERESVVCVCVCVCVCLCVCVCVCVFVLTRPGRTGQRADQWARPDVPPRNQEGVCVRERDRARESVCEREREPGDSVSVRKRERESADACRVLGAQDNAPINGRDQTFLLEERCPGESVCEREGARVCVCV